MRLNTVRRHNPQPWGDGEIDSIYVNPSDRFVVSFIVSYSTNELTTVYVPTEGGSTRKPRNARDYALAAAAAALDLTTDPDGKEGTKWFVYDRHTGVMHEFEQGDFEEADVL